MAIVGSQSATPQGSDDAPRFAHVRSDAGLSIVSGLALGIDGAAHRAGPSGPGGTIAVIGTGADLVYPPLHHALAHEIATNGTIVSQWRLGTPVRPANFAQRNRLIAGLVSGVLIVEAAARSGSLATARLANEMGRDVFGIIRPPGLDPRAAVAWVSSDDPAGREACGNARGHSRGVRFCGSEQCSGGARFEAANASWASASIKPANPETDRLLDALGHSGTRARRLKFLPSAPKWMVRRYKACCCNSNCRDGLARCRGAALPGLSADFSAPCYIRDKIRFLQTQQMTDEKDRKEPCPR